MRALVLGALLGVSLSFPSRANATPLDPSFAETTFVTGVSGATGMAWAPDASRRLFFTIKTGEVRIIEDGVLVATPFATITPVQTSGECGVVGVAFDPDFMTNGFVYFFVTVSVSEQQIIRYTASGNGGTDKTTIVAGLPTSGANHDGGGVGVGPDGKLYFAVGDLGATSGVDADLSSSAAKVGRVNRDGSVPADNPFFDGAGPNEDRIWARGFRNPFSLTFQPATDLLWVNAVGTQYEQVFIVKAGAHAGWNDYENDQPQGFITPVVVYQTNGIDTYVLAPDGATRKNGITTFKTETPHRLRLGTEITASTVDPSFNAPGYVSAIHSATEVSMAQAGPDATSGGGAIRTTALGGAITGGAFWDSSGVPAVYRGDFFFGDYNSGRTQRVDLDASNTVTAVRDFGNGFTSPIDVSVGPNGDLYYLNYGGAVRRVSYNFTEQALVVSKLHLRAFEGGSGSFHVRLATRPSAALNVSVARSSGDDDVGVTEGALLSFDAATWATPQPVKLAVSQDVDSAEDTATIAVSSAGLATENLTVRVTDDDPLSLVLSTESVTLDEGGTARFEISLSGPPSGSLVANVTRSAGSSDVSVVQGAQLSFDTANFAMPQTVALAALVDDDTTDDSATIRIDASGLETRELSVAVRDVRPPAITTNPVTTGTVGSAYSYDIDATGVPTVRFLLDQAPSGMRLDGASGVLSWAPAVTGSFNVTVRATNGVAPDATQGFAITVAASPSTAAATPGADAGGCGCRTDNPTQSQTAFALWLMALWIAGARRTARSRFSACSKHDG